MSEIPNSPPVAPFDRQSTRQPPGPRVLLLCHISAAQSASAAAAAMWPAAAARGEVDLLGYGRSHRDFPAQLQTRLIQLPELSGSPARRLAAASALVWRLRRAHYDIAVVSQPALKLSRARGLLLAFPFVIGIGRVLIADPRHDRTHQISRRAALTDLARWGLLHIMSAVVARLAAAVVDLAQPRSAPRPARPPHHGSVIYLRTDVDLVLGPLRAGGSASHTDGVIRALGRRGFDIELWSTGTIEGLPGVIPQRRLRAILMGNLPIEVAELASGLMQFVRPPSATRPTAFVYQRYSLNNLAGLLLARRWKVPFVLEANASEAAWRREWSSLKYPRLADACERVLLTHADRVVTVSRNAAEGLLTAGVPPGRLRVVPNGVDLEQFAAAKPAQLDLPSTAVVICFVGLFYPWHGVRYLAEAFVRLHRTRPDARLLLVGDGEEAPVVTSILREGGALDATVLTGIVPRERVPELLAAADVLVSPHAPNETFVGSPIKIFEYMAARRAIVVSRVGQMSDLLRDGHTALVVPPGDPLALAAALERLCDDDALRERLASAAETQAREHHSWDARVDTLLAEEVA